MFEFLCRTTPPEHQDAAFVAKFLLPGGGAAVDAAFDTSKRIGSAAPGKSFFDTLKEVRYWRKNGNFRSLFEELLFVKSRQQGPEAWWSQAYHVIQSHLRNDGGDFVIPFCHTVVGVLQDGSSSSGGANDRRPTLLSQAPTLDALVDGFGGTSSSANTGGLSLEKFVIKPLYQDRKMLQYCRPLSVQEKEQRDADDLLARARGSNNSAADEAPANGTVVPKRSERFQSFDDNEDLLGAGAGSSSAGNGHIPSGKEPATDGASGGLNADKLAGLGDASSSAGTGTIGSANLPGWMRRKMDSRLQTRREAFDQRSLGQLSLPGGLRNLAGIGYRGLNSSANSAILSFGRGGADDSFSRGGLAGTPQTTTGVNLGSQSARATKGFLAGSSAAESTGTGGATSAQLAGGKRATAFDNLTVNFPMRTSLASIAGTGGGERSGSPEDSKAPGSKVSVTGSVSSKSKFPRKRGLPPDLALALSRDALDVAARKRRRQEKLDRLTGGTWSRCVSEMKKTQLSAAKELLRNSPKSPKKS